MAKRFSWMLFCLLSLWTFACTVSAQLQNKHGKLYNSIHEKSGVVSLGEDKKVVVSHSWRRRRRRHRRWSRRRKYNHRRRHRRHRPVRRWKKRSQKIKIVSFSCKKYQHSTVSLCKGARLYTDSNWKLHSLQLKRNDYSLRNIEIIKTPNADVRSKLFPKAVASFKSKYTAQYFVAISEKCMVGNKPPAWVSRAGWQYTTGKMQAFRRGNKRENYKIFQKKMHPDETVTISSFNKMGHSCKNNAVYFIKSLDNNSPVTRCGHCQCRISGDPHYLQIFSGRKRFDLGGEWINNVQTKNCDFRVQTFSCSKRDITRALAITIGNSVLLYQFYDLDCSKRAGSRYFKRNSLKALYIDPKRSGKTVLTPSLGIFKKGNRNQWYSFRDSSMGYEVKFQINYVVRIQISVNGETAQENTGFGICGSCKTAYYPHKRHQRTVYENICGGQTDLNEAQKLLKYYIPKNENIWKTYFNKGYASVPRTCKPLYCRDGDEVIPIGSPPEPKQPICFSPKPTPSPPTPAPTPTPPTPAPKTPAPPTPAPPTPAPTTPCPELPTPDTPSPETPHSSTTFAKQCSALKPGGVCASKSKKHFYSVFNNAMKVKAACWWMDVCSVLKDSYFIGLDTSDPEKYKEICGTAPCEDVPQVKMTPDRIVTINGLEYATLDFAKPNGVNLQGQHWDQQSGGIGKYGRLPSGWDIVPPHDENIIKISQKFSFETSCLLVGDETQIVSTAQSNPLFCAVGSLDEITEGGYKCFRSRHPRSRILIYRAALPKKKCPLSKIVFDTWVTPSNGQAQHTSKIHTADVFREYVSKDAGYHVNEWFYNLISNPKKAPSTKGTFTDYLRKTALAGKFVMTAVRDSSSDFMYVCGVGGNPNLNYPTAWNVGINTAYSTYQIRWLVQENLAPSSHQNIYEPLYSGDSLKSHMVFVPSKSKIHGLCVGPIQPRETGCVTINLHPLSEEARDVQILTDFNAGGTCKTHDWSLKKDQNVDIMLCPKCSL